MGLSLRENSQGILTVIAGPNHRRNRVLIERLLNSAKKGRVWLEENILVIKHPLEDNKNPRRIGTHDAIETDDANKISEHITEKTEAVIISGVNHYNNAKIVDLIDAIVLSNRNIIVSGINVDSFGLPEGFMPEIMTLADEIVLTDARCGVTGCNSRATRIQKKDDKYKYKCVNHHSFSKRADQKIHQLGELYMFVGPMFASKTTEWEDMINECKKGKYAVFKFIGANRYDVRGEIYKPFDNGHIETNDGRYIPAIVVRDAEDIRFFLQRNPEITHVFIDEGQFISGVFNLVHEGIYQGYKFFVTGLRRDFRRAAFGEMRRLLPIASKINIQSAYCVQCGAKGTETQRLIHDKTTGQWMPAGYDDPITIIGGNEEEGEPNKYEARCKHCWSVPGSPKKIYEFERFKEN